MFEFNHCCVVHDECYTHRLGRAHCDDKFCACGGQVTKKYNSTAGCFSMVQTACMLVTDLGGDSYNLSTGYQEPADMAKYTPKDGDLAAAYEKLYSSCPSHNGTTSSCALMYNYCSNGTGTCRGELCTCVQMAYEQDQDELCGQEVQSVCRLLVPPKEPADHPAQQVLNGRVKKLLGVLESLPNIVAVLLAVVVAVICALQKRDKETTPRIVHIL